MASETVNKNLDIFSGTMNEFKMLIYGLFLYLDISLDLMSILVLLMIIDTCLGPIKVLRIDPTIFSFKQIVIGFFTKVALLSLPLSVALIMKGLGIQWQGIVTFSMKLLIVSEGISNLSNLVSIKTRTEVKDFDLITRFVKYLRGTLIQIGEHMLSNINSKKDGGDKTPI